MECGRRWWQSAPDPSEIDDLTHLVLRFVNAGNVRKGHRNCLGINRSGALQRRHATRHHANEDETRHSEQQETHRDGAVPPSIERLRLAYIEADAALGEAAHEVGFEAM